MQGTISGKVQHQNGQPFVKGIVQLFHKPDLTREIFLREGITTETGTYRLQWDYDQPLDPKNRIINLVVRVCDSEGTLRGEESLPKATVQAQLHVTVTPPVRLSQLEQIEMALSPLRGDRAYGSLTDEDIAFLSGAAKLQRSWLIDLRGADQAVEKTGFPLTACYGWIRQGLSLELHQWLFTSPSTLRTTLETAIEGQIIPRWEPQELDGIIVRFEQLQLEHGVLVAREFLGQLVNEGTQEPLVGLAIRAVDLDAPEGPRELGETITARSGHFTFTYVAPSTATSENGTSAGAENWRRLQLHILSNEDEEVLQREVRVKVEQGMPLVIDIPFSGKPEPEDMPIVDLENELELQLSPPLRHVLEENQLNTLRDILRASDLRSLISTATNRDHEIIRTLEAHAHLSLLSNDIRVRQTMMTHGYTKGSDLARLPREEIIRTLGGEFGDLTASTLHEKAKAQVQLTDQILAGLRIDGYYGTPMYDKAPPMNSPEQQFEYPHILDLKENYFRPDCTCDDCNAAVSPLAYLADLLAYTSNHLRIGLMNFLSGEPPSYASATWLQETFHQLFRDLPTACAEVEERVRQVRICIEVLRGYLQDNWASLSGNLKVQLEEGVNAYLEDAYRVLLTNLGTSYDELRIAQSMDEKDRAAIGERLGIQMLEGDPLAELFFDLGGVPPLTESSLEQLFGLVDSTRDPLSDGAKFHDDQFQIRRWEFQGVEWERNTDRRGTIYVRIWNESSSAFHIEVYRDSARSELVAAGKRATGSGPVTLFQRNKSGLSGEMQLVYWGGTSTIEISVIPTVVGWRLAYLQWQWKRQDWPVDSFSPEVDVRVPILDPDVVGPDDFRNSVAGEAVFDLWLQRRLWVDDQLDNLKTLRESTGLEAALNQVFGGTFPDLDALETQLNSGPDAQAAMTDIEAELRLTVESFRRLMEIRTKDRQNAQDPEFPSPTETEWREVYSILVQSQKRALFPTWVAEEDQQGIRLGPMDFWRSIREPNEGLWPPESMPNRPWIDPETVSSDDLPDSVIGSAALVLWEARRSILFTIRNDLRTAREVGGLDAMLAQAIGDPNPGDAIPHDLDQLQSDLDSSDSTVVQNAQAAIQSDLYLSVSNFIRLMVIRAKAAQPAPPLQPSEAEWEEVLEFLTSAQKRKREFPLWLSEEQQQGLTEAYWAVLKAKLPLWRAIPLDRHRWHEGLHKRSMVPTIEPDLLDLDDLRDLSWQNTAYALFQARGAWVGNQLLALSATAKDLPTFDGHILSSLGISGGDLQALLKREEEGIDIAARLEQLTLTRDAFLYLGHVRQLLGANATVLESEWEDVYSIFVHVQKQRRYGLWKEEEQELGFFLNPAEFRLRGAFEEMPLSNWRANIQSRWEWEGKLKTRLDQQQSVGDGLQQVVNEAEESVLEQLRDVLILASGANGTQLPSKAKHLADILLIDTQTDVCQYTTRVAQAIQTLQSLLFSVRTSLLRDTYPSLHLTDEDFDERWNVLGTYANWRAFMFVFLYPENFLQPSLRPWQTQTPAFQALVRQVRGYASLSPRTACELAQQYADYYRDVCHLSVGATCLVDTHIKNADCGRPVQDSGRRPLFYLFARSTETNRAYFSTYDPADSSGYAQSFWTKIPELDNVTEILGAVPFERSQTERYIYLFVRLKEQSQSIFFLKYDLERPEWVEGVGELDIPRVGKPGKILVVQRAFTDVPPTLVISRFEGDFDRENVYVRSLDEGGGNWEAEVVEDNGEPKNEGPGSEGLWDDYYHHTTFQTEKFFAVLEIEFDPYSTRLLFCHRGTSSWDYQIVVNMKASTMPAPQMEMPNLAAWFFEAGIFHGAQPVPGGLAVFIGTKRHVINISSTDLFTHSHMNGLGRVVPHYGPWGLWVNNRWEQHNLVYHLGTKGPCRINFNMAATSDAPVAVVALARVAPHVEAVDDASGLSLSFDITEKLTPSQLQMKREAIETWFIKNLEDPDNPKSNLVYLKEAYCFVSIEVALGLQQEGYCTAALDWFRTVYDFTAPTPEAKKIYYGLKLEEQIPWASAYERQDDWLLGQANPHGVIRAKVLTRYMHLAIIRCLLDCANADFTLDTAESLARARLLYLTALELLDSSVLKQHLGNCENLIGSLEIELGGNAGSTSLLEKIFEKSQSLTFFQMKKMSGDIQNIVGEAVPWNERVVKAFESISSFQSTAPFARRLGDVLVDYEQDQHRLRSAVLAHDDTRAVVRAASEKIAFDFSQAMGKWMGDPGVNLGDAANDIVIEPYIVENLKLYQPPPVAPTVFKFCVPPNPLLKALRLEVESSLLKLRTCRNIAGLRRDVDPYAAPTDTETGISTLSENGPLVIPGLRSQVPTLYRYGTLIERAKQLVSLAQQVETAYLSALEKKDAEEYTVLKARQDITLAHAGVRLQVRRVREAQINVTLAGLQRQKAQIQMDHFTSLLNEGHTTLESLALAHMYSAVGFHTSAAVLNSIGINSVTAGGAGASSTAAALSTMASIFSTYASYERREQEWTLQKDLARQDVLIGAQQLQIARVHVGVVIQERVIANLQADHAESTLNFLINKFTSAEFWHWMSGVLKGVTRYFLQQATSTAQLAAIQLGFQRQEIPPSFIQADYWEAPDKGAVSFEASNGNGNVDRRGLTGSTRLLQDIYRLDQYAFETDQRKLHLKKTISLAQLSPIEFQQFRETGVMLFATPMKLFDWDFPGHYLRLISLVRMNIFALIPPHEGIHATLSTTGLSYTVIEGKGLYQKTRIKRPPESVALTSPVNETGLSELTPQEGVMLRPFEGTGVETSWELRMPKASNPINYNTIADVLLTVEYTALDSPVYRQQVIQELDDTVWGDRTWSFRHQFADDWYHLHNPEQSASPMTARLSTRQQDFPPNIGNLRIQHVVLYFVRKQGIPFEVPVEDFRFQDELSPGTVGGGAISIDGIISTRRGNAGSWTPIIGKSPEGHWTLKLPNTHQMRNRFKDGQIEDILFIITYSGRTPSWPI